MPSIRQTQTSWSAGQIDRVAEGRPDVSIYNNGARALANWRHLVTGGVTGRPGTLLEITGDANERRLYAFMFSESERYLIVMRFTTLEAYPINADDSLGAATTITFNDTFPTLTTDTLKEVQVSQRANTLVMTHGDHGIYKLLRTGATTFDFDEFDFETDSANVTYLPFFAFQDAGVTINPSATSGTITLTTSVDYWDQSNGHDDLFIEIGGKQVQVTSVSSATVANATVIETLASSSVTEEWQEQAFSTLRGWPRAVAFHGKRLWFGGTTSLPVHIWASKASAFFNFDVGEALANESIQGPIVSDSVAEILTLTSGRVMIVGTDQGTVYLPETDADPLTPDTFNPRFISPNPVSRQAPPLRYNRAIVFAQRDGAVMREIVFDTLDSEFTADPVTLTQTDLFIPDYRDSASLYALPNDPIELAFVVNSTGTIAVYHAIREENIRGALPWTFAKPDGSAIECFSLVGIGETLYGVLKWDQDGTDIYSVVRFSEDTTLDLATPITNGTAQSDWTGQTVYANEDVDIVSQADDGTNTLANAYYLGQAAVDGSGDFTIPDETEIKDGYIGFGFLPTMEQLPVAIEARDGTRINRPYRIGETLVLLHNTSTLKVDDTTFTFRETGFDPSVIPERFTGVKTHWGVGWGRRLTTDISAAEPLPITVTLVEREVHF